MKRVVFIYFFILTATLLNAQDVSFDWAKQMAGKGGFGSGNSITTDAAGNVYTVGSFDGSVDFNPGPGVYSFTSRGSSDIFVSKSDTAGNLVWAVQMGGYGAFCEGKSIAVDAAGNIYVGAGFSGTVNFNSGYNLTSIGSSVIIRLNANGNTDWVKQTAFSSTMVVDPVGNVYTTGFFSGTVDFDPGPGVFNLSSSGGGSGLDMAFLKLDASGNFVWVKQMGGVSSTDGAEGYTMAMNAAGNVYIAGNFYGTVDFDPGPGIFNLSAGGNTSTKSIFILKSDTNGNFLWVKQIDNLMNNGGSMSIAVDQSGNVYTAGAFTETVDFDPGAGVFNLSSAGAQHSFILRLNTNGNFVWAKQIGTAAMTSIAIDPLGNVYFTGAFGGTVDFDPGPAIFNLSSTVGYANNGNMCTSELDTSGNFVWAKQVLATGSGYSIGYSITLDAWGNIYTTGTFAGTNDFDPSVAVYNLSTYFPPGFAQDIFIQKLEPCIKHYTIHKAICAGQNYFGYTTAGKYIDTLPATNGCDTVRTIYLTINQKSFSVIDATICATQNYSGHSVTGIYVDTLIAANGCDSIRTLNLAVRPVPFSTMAQSICYGQTYAGHNESGTYTDTLIAANGCDSLHLLYLTVYPKRFSIMDTAICYGQHFEGLTTSGTYTTTYHTVDGCDSLRTINLTVLPQIKPLLGHDTTICVYDELILYPGEFNTYTWQDGSTQSHFTVHTGGLYSVTVSDQCGSGHTEILIKTQSCTINFPSAFTPNNDGKNDLFKILNTPVLSEYDLMIYNRWGQKIFETRDYTKGWDGTINGQTADTGIYAWFCRFKKPGSIQNETMKGTIALIK